MLNSKLKLWVAASILAVGIASCGGIFAVNLTKQDEIDQRIRKKLEEYTDSQAIVYNIYLSCINDFSVFSDVITVTYLLPGSNEPKQWTLLLAGNTEPRKSITNIRSRERARIDVGIINANKS